MPKVIALVSKSKRLLISLRNKDCHLAISEDQTTLLFQMAQFALPTSRISLQLSTDEKLIHSFTVPCHNRGRRNSVRVDSLFPIVFGDSEQIDCVWTMYPSHLATDEREVFVLRVALISDFSETFSRITGKYWLAPTLAKINSVSIKVDSATVSLSKEVLGVSSDFFSNLFYGNFMEKNTGSYCIKEVDEKDFIWLINSLMERKWNLTSVDQALSVLSIADRFCMTNVHKRILPYLKTTDLDPITENRIAALKRYIDLATRCSDNGEFVSWIFEKCQTTTELIDVAQSCGTTLTPHMAVFFQFLTTKNDEQIDEKNALEKKMTGYKCYNCYKPGRFK